MTIFDALKKDHDELKQLLAKLDTKKDAPDFADQFARLKTLVIVHARAEEDTFYAELEEFDALEEHAERAIGEHEAVEAMLGELSAGELGSTAWRLTFAEMREALLRHIRDEEHELFAQARAVLREADLERISRAFFAERDRLVGGATPAPVKRRA